MPAFLHVRLERGQFFRQQVCARTADHHQRSIVGDASAAGKLQRSHNEVLILQRSSGFTVALLRLSAARVVLAMAADEVDVLLLPMLELEQGLRDQLFSRDRE